jgi:hypothetical protein
MKQVGGFDARPRLAETRVLRRVATRVGRCGVPVALTLVLLLAQVSAAQGAIWQGEITLTRSTETFKLGVRESQRVEERWTDITVRRDGITSVFLRATWTVAEARSSSNEDCSMTGHAAGTEPYTSLLFELDPFEKLQYVLYSSGTGESPEVRGTGTRTCRNREPVTFTYSVRATWLQPVLEHVNVTPFGVTGRIDPEHPHVISGSAVVEVEGGTAVLAWDLVRPLVCADTPGAEYLAREAGIVRDAQTSDEGAMDRHEAQESRTPLSAADVAGAMARAIGAPEHVALQAPVESGETGIQSFAVRVSGAGGTLPTLEHVRAMLEITCVEEASLEGARLLIVGTVQWVGHRFRITVRVVDVETGAMLDVLRVDGAGDRDDLSAAFGGAFARAVAR